LSRIEIKTFIFLLVKHINFGCKHATFLYRSRVLWGNRLPFIAPYKVISAADIEGRLNKKIQKQIKQSRVDKYRHRNN